MAKTKSYVSPTQLLDANDFRTHMIPAEEKTAQWGRSIFLATKPYLRAAFGGGYGVATSNSNNYDAQLIKSFAEGNQPVERYIVVFDPQDKTGEYMGLNWNVTGVVPNSRRRVLADLYKIPSAAQCSAIDELANNQRNLDRLRLKAEPILNEKLDKFSKRIGYDKPIKSNLSKNILNKKNAGQDFNFDTQNDEELDILMSSNYYSQDVEIAEEVVQQAVFKYSEFDNLMQKVKEDAVDYALGAFRIYCDEFTGMPLYQYMFPYRVFIQQSKFKDYHDSLMWYYRPPATLEDVLSQMGHELTDEDVKEIWEKSTHRRPEDYPSYGVYGWDWRRWNNGDLRKIEIDLYYFEVKSPDNITYVESKTKNGKTKIKKKEYNGKQINPESDVTENNYWAECVYKGYYIEGVSKVYSWGKLKNMPREIGHEQFTPFSLVMYRFAEKGLTELAIPYADRHQEAFLKMQHAILKSLPRGYSFNWDALSEINIGDGGKLTQMDLIKMYTQTGSTIHRTRDENGDLIMANANAPHMLMENGVDPNIMFFLQVMNDMDNRIALTYGINPIADAVNPHPKLGLGVSQNAQAASANARYFLYDGIQQMLMKAATITSSMIADIIRYDSDTTDKLKRMVGAINPMVIDSLDDIPAHQFGFYFEPVPTEDEIKEFKGMVMQSAAGGQIDPADLLQLNFMSNYKLAIQLFNLKRRKQIEMMQKGKAQELQTAQATEAMLSQIKIQIAQIQSDTARSVADANGKFLLISTEMKETSKINTKLLQEFTKLNLANEDKSHDHSLVDKENAQALTEIAAQKEADISTIKTQGENDIALAKAQPKPQPSASA